MSDVMDNTIYMYGFHPNASESRLEAILRLNDHAVPVVVMYEDLMADQSIIEEAVVDGVVKLCRAARVDHADAVQWIRKQWSQIPRGQSEPS